MAKLWVRFAPPDFSELMYGALELPITWLYAWFSMTTTTVWAGVGTEPAAWASPPRPAHRPADAAARPAAVNRAVRLRLRTGYLRSGGEWDVQGLRCGWCGRYLRCGGYLRCGVHAKGRGGRG